MVPGPTANKNQIFYKKINKNYRKYVQIVRIIGKNFSKNFAKISQLVKFSEKLYHKFSEKSNFL